ncbi:hypothetical protein CEXT_716351 [Caerostris extrusa]|uniref:Uncharacterized protein n=1 Tax=Caerostris extrusa TaxID=172846 RepID=A0AAV4NPN2_CAEEX|nr:hypothetical protein CEXT_716351 [Caerostris extrusa]
MASSGLLHFQNENFFETGNAKHGGPSNQFLYLSISFDKEINPRSHGGTSHAGFGPAHHVLGGSSGPQLYLSGVAIAIRSFGFGRLRAGRNELIECRAI